MHCSTKQMLGLYPCDVPLVCILDRLKIYFHLILQPTDPPEHILITITPIDRNGKKNLRVARDTNLSGTVTPYGFDGLADYTVNMDACLDLTPPPGHSVMLSFPHMNIKPSLECRRDHLVLEVYHRMKRTPIWRRCGVLQLPPELNTYRPKLLLRFFTRSYRSMIYTGFKIRFSFHDASELPHKLQNKNQTVPVFNCSVPFFAKFRQHLDCNLETECLHAEDEANCPYSQGVCEPGFLNDGTKCYKYVRTGKTMTWFDASMVCLKGMSLASFPTSEQLDRFRHNILRFAHTPFKVYIGLRTSKSSLSPMYRDVWQWSSGTMAYGFRNKKQVFKPKCAAFAPLTRRKAITSCGVYEHMQFVFCEVETTAMFNVVNNIDLPPQEVNSTFGLKDSARFVTCSEGHVTHDFLSCDVISRCGAEREDRSCVTKNVINSDTIAMRLKIPMYVCDTGQAQTIHYTQLCDHHPQCFDSSDESFCIHQACTEKQCQNQQCIPATQWCDGMAQCSDGSDEACFQFVTGSENLSSSLKSVLYIVSFDGYGKYKYVPGDAEFPLCPPTHFLCANRQLCIPVYLRCNEVFDCPNHEDEIDCDDVMCPGYYRCRETAICLHNDHVCDGVFQCPQQDDELLCHLFCPDNCSCQGLAFLCPQPFPVQKYTDIRYLDASQSGLTPDTLFLNYYLVRLSLSRCGLHSLPPLQFPNMKILDLGNNIMTNISMQVFLMLPNLNFLSLSGNPIFNIVAPESKILMENVYSLDLSHTSLKYFDSMVFYNVRNMKYLNLSNGMLKVIGNTGFGSLTKIESLDLRGTGLKHYPVHILQSLSSLHALFSDVYKLCCPDILPEQLKTENCQTTPNEIASCKDLLRADIYRLLLWIICAVAVAGNTGGFIAQIYMQMGKPPNSFNVFIAHLNISDFLMGLYLVIIGSADQVYRGVYLWHDEEWKSSSSCKAAGLFSLLSSEMSAFIICFITLDRFLVTRFPFSQLRFRYTSAQVVCGFCWFVSVALASLPLFPITAHWEFYSQTDICIPLPVTRQNFKGRFYSFGILIALNFFLFVFIAVGQLFIYVSIRENSFGKDQKNAREATIARRLLTVVLSDFLCWFPVGLLGVMTSNGTSVPSEVNVVIAILALPINSALNPFLYTINLIREKRQKASEQRLLKMLQRKYLVEMKSENAK